MKILLSLIKFICIVSALVSPIALTVNLISSPWPGDEIAKSETKGYLGMPIGGSFVGEVRKSKGYLLFPLSMNLPKYFKVEIYEGKYYVGESYFGFWFFVIAIIYGWFLIIRFMKKKLNRQVDEPNK
jgi:hypothetical protein